MTDTGLGSGARLPHLSPVPLAPSVSRGHLCLLLASLELLPSFHDLICVILACGAVPAHKEKGDWIAQQQNQLQSLRVQLHQFLKAPVQGHATQSLFLSVKQEVLWGTTPGETLPSTYTLKCCNSLTRMRDSFYNRVFKLIREFMQEILPPAGAAYQLQLYLALQQFGKLTYN